MSSGTGRSMRVLRRPSESHESEFVSAQMMLTRVSVQTGK